MTAIVFLFTEVPRFGIDSCL